MVKKNGKSSIPSEAFLNVSRRVPYLAYQQPLLYTVSLQKSTIKTFFCLATHYKFIFLTVTFNFDSLLLEPT